jgi:DNA-binding IclR family transcriptional regulator
LSVRDGAEMLVVATRESPAMVRAVADVGVRMPMHATAAGKAVLAYLPDATVDSIIAETRLPPFTPRTITTPAALKEELQKVRDTGYAVHDEEWTEGLYALGAPFHDQEGVRGAVVIAAPTSLLPSSDLDLLVSATKGAAERLSTFQTRPSARISGASRLS